ncbi:MAG: DUF503 family protein [Dehalococcoidia bacterium]|jgi:uncharacterized protein YlxP (DUF503 family)
MPTPDPLWVSALAVRPYHKVIRGDEVDGFLAEAPELPGCVTVGATVEEAQEMLHDAIRNGSKLRSPRARTSRNLQRRDFRRNVHSMPIALVRIRLRLPSRTLKEKRTIVKSVVERLRNRFNASVAELDDLDSAGVATIGAAVLSNDARHADEQAQAIVAAVEGWRLDAELIDLEVELIDG